VMAGSVEAEQAPIEEVDYELAYDHWMRLCSAVVMGFIRNFGPDAAAEVERSAMRRHQTKHFISGLAKLGLLDETNDVLRCAKYHYFSNVLGGLPLEYVEESPTKIWLRYRAPYWVGDGVGHSSAGPAGMPSALGRAPFLGWHANNGAVLGNPNLVFIQTQNLLDGDPWDAGYYTELNEEQEPGVAYKRRTGEWGPEVDPAGLPRLPHDDWPELRKRRALRNYAVSTTASRVSTACDVLGVEETATVVQHAFTAVLSQFWRALPQAMGISSISSASDAASYFARVLALNGDSCRVEGVDDRTVIVRHPVSRFWRHEEFVVQEIDRAIGNAWSRSLTLYGSRLSCSLALPSDVAGERVWTFSHRATN
jgi:hypothetical protein